MLFGRMVVLVVAVDDGAPDGDHHGVAVSVAALGAQPPDLGGTDGPPGVVVPAELHQASADLRREERWPI